MAAVLERQRVAVRPTGAALGADVEGIDLAGALAPETIAAVKAAWGDHLVLRFRDQTLSDDDLMRFSRQLGELDWAPVAAAKVKVPGEDRYIDGTPEGRQYVMVISNVIENGVAIGQLGAYEAIWHTDMSYIAEPPMASALYSLEVPASGGDTGFCNMYRVYETLTPELRQQLDGRLCRHDASRNSAGELRRGYVDAPDASQTVGAEHPLVRTHPATGRKALFLGRRRNAYIPGMDLAESEALLDALWAHATKREFSWYQQWQVGDLILWDNRCVMHRRDAFDPDARRIMHRTQIKGDRPI
ncbi:MAG TPA: TauD/TfdA family dioxygenase [Stellaceae bacterium]|jgi:taurine dioxygenase|nr:TauD/TfdA family dioxygenase [Stellaceae bacterium]